MDLQSIRETAFALKEQILSGAGGWAPVILALVFIGSACTGMPVFYITVLAGMMFGLWSGYALIMASLMATVVIVHLLVRGLLRNWVRKRLEKDRRLAALDSAVSADGAKIVFLLRMTPLLPLGIGSYLFSLTGIRTVPYFLATLLGTAPGTFFYVWLGSTLNNTAAGLGDQASRYAIWMQWAGLTAFGIAFVYSSLLIRKALGRLQLEEFEKAEALESKG